MHNHRIIANGLSKAQAEMLLEHLDGAWVPAPIEQGVRSATRAGLLRIELIRFEGAKQTPTHTVITEVGRSVLAHVLSNYADALIRAGYLIAEAPAIEIPSDLRRMMPTSVKSAPPVFPHPKDDRVAIGPD